MSKLSNEEKILVLREQFLKIFKLAQEKELIVHDDLPYNDRVDNLNRIPRHLLGYGSGFFKERDLNKDAFTIDFCATKNTQFGIIDRFSKYLNEDTCHLLENEMKNYQQICTGKNEFPSLYLIDCLLQCKPRNFVIGSTYPGTRRDIVLNEMSFSDLLIVIGSTISALNNRFLNSAGVYIDGFVYPINRVIELFLECDKQKLNEFALSFINQEKTTNGLIEMQKRHHRRHIDTSDWKSDENIKILGEIVNKCFFFKPEIDFWNENSKLVLKNRDVILSGRQLAQFFNNDESELSHLILSSFSDIYKCDDCSDILRESVPQIDISDYFKNYVKPFPTFILLCLINTFKRAKVETKRIPDFLELEFVFEPIPNQYNVYYMDGMPFSKFCNGLIQLYDFLHSLKKFGLNFSEPIKSGEDEIIRLQCKFQFDCYRDCEKAY